MTQLDRLVEKGLEASLAELGRLVAIPSVSAQRQDLPRCAAEVAGMLSRRGFQVELLGEEGGAPVVYAERAGRSDATLLVYNHYDVQPPEPLEEWSTPPFEATRSGGLLYGRGVNDDKGHFTSRLLALDALLARDGDLPCRVKWVVDGEEETISHTLAQAIRDLPGKFAADACIWEFGTVDHEDRPVETLGVRGICYVQLSVETANQDLHSGLAGSILPNAAWRLVWALRTIKGADENVRIAGFYNKVRPVPAAARRLLEALPDQAPHYREQFGVGKFLKGIQGGAELRLAEAHEPSCTICGLSAGYQGEGAKTVLPARASAKLEFRLVPDQRPEEIFELLREHLIRNDFADIQLELLAHERPAVTDPDHPFIRIVTGTAEEVYGTPMLVVPSVGGSGPNALFSDHYSFPIASAGVGHPTMQAHAPNENLRLDLYLKGARHFARILLAFGKGRPAGSKPR